MNQFSGPPQGEYDAPIERVALLHVGVETHFDAADVLDRLYDRLSLGGFVVIDGFADELHTAGFEVNDRLVDIIAHEMELVLVDGSIRRIVGRVEADL